MIKVNWLYKDSQSSIIHFDKIKKIYIYFKFNVKLLSYFLNRKTNFHYKIINYLHKKENMKNITMD